MGMFDYVWVNCPICGREIEFQSKGGPCNLNNYQLHNAPARVQTDLIGDGAYCCGVEIEIQPIPLVQAVIKGKRPVEFDPDNDY
jgi:hypothetical protein